MQLTTIFAIAVYASLVFAFATPVPQSAGGRERTLETRAEDADDAGVRSGNTTINGTITGGNSNSGNSSSNGGNNGNIGNNGNNGGNSGNSTVKGNSNQANNGNSGNSREWIVPRAVQVTPNKDAGFELSESASSMCLPRNLAAWPVTQSNSELKRSKRSLAAHSNTCPVRGWLRSQTKEHYKSAQAVSSSSRSGTTSGNPKARIIRSVGTVERIKVDQNPPTRVICPVFDQQRVGATGPARRRTRETGEDVSDMAVQGGGDDSRCESDGSEHSTEEDEDALFSDSNSTFRSYAQRDSMESESNNTNITTPSATPPSLSKHALALPLVDEEREWHRCRCCRHTPNILTTAPPFQRSSDEAGQYETQYYIDFYNFVRTTWNNKVTAKSEHPAEREDFGGGMSTLTVAAAYLRAIDLLGAMGHRAADGRNHPIKIFGQDYVDEYSTESLALDMVDGFVKVRGLLERADYSSSSHSREGGWDFERERASEGDMWLDYYTRRFSEIIANRCDIDEATDDDDDEQVESPAPTGVSSASKDASTTSRKRKAPAAQLEVDSKVLKTRFLKARRTTKKVRETGPKRGGSGK
ncbi:hypothetical protein PLEOSDRAFT_168475 [Pleurotus ostreatus PC15]|uniref:Uncharacterized protein n=1 Tax=Pleurotus ostreatus (strain PC15) TaxID=1137138 RepID=A0A067NUV5_PLEO1|nr:hypothetical protein PLEOSDRAFT_168475 [Pleurotus ostreatus PC15]